MVIRRSGKLALAGLLALAYSVMPVRGDDNVCDYSMFEEPIAVLGEAIESKNRARINFAYRDLLSVYQSRRQVQHIESLGAQEDEQGYSDSNAMIQAIMMAPTSTTTGVSALEEVTLVDSNSYHAVGRSTIPTDMFTGTGLQEEEASDLINKIYSGPPQ